MERYGLIEELQLIAIANDWWCVVGSRNEANSAILQKYYDTKIKDNQLLLWIDDSYTPNRGAAGKLESLPYIASINLLGKREDTGNESSLDETVEQKRARRIKEIAQILDSTINSFICANNLAITAETLTPVYNLFDLNLDGIAGAITLVQTDFTAPSKTFDITLGSSVGGSVLPYEGTQAKAKYSHLGIAAYPEPNYAFEDWSDNNTDQARSIFVNKDKNLVANFISSLVTIQDVFGTDPVKNGDKHYFEDNTKAANDYKIFFDGNSIMLSLASCAGSVTVQNSFTTQLTNLLLNSTGQNIEYLNLGKSGYKGSDMDNNFDTDILPYIDPTKTNVLVFFEFANQMGAPSSQTAQQAYESIKNVGIKGKAAGMLVIVMTAPYSTAVPNIQDANDLLIADHSFADYLIRQDIVLDSVAMNDSNISCDGTHLKDAGIALQSNDVNDQWVSQEIFPIIERNNVQIKNTPVLHLGGTDSYVTFPTGILGNNIDLRYIFSNVVYVANMGILTSGTNFRFYIDLVTGYIKARVRVMGGAYETATFNNLIFNQFIWDLDINIDFDEHSVTINNQKHIFSTTFFAAITTLVAGFASSYAFMEGDIHYFSVDDGSVSGEYYFEEGEGAVNYNSNGTMGSAAITGVNNSHGASEFAEPGLIKKGYTRFVKDGFPAIFRRVIYLNGAPQLGVLAGFTKVADIPTFVCSNSYNTFEGIVYPALAGEKTFQEISDEPVTDFFEKPGETTNTIPQVIVKE
jgi:hypothetical protein